MVNGRKANGSYISGDLQFKGNGWIPLDLPSTVIDGNVFFIDNGNGTAGLAGTIRSNVGKNSGAPTLLLNPPAGYVFTSANWDEGTGYKGSAASYGFGKRSGGIWYGVIPLIINGALWVYSNSSDTYNNMTIWLTAAASDSSSLSANPAIVGIAKV